MKKINQSNRMIIFLITMFMALSSLFVVPTNVSFADNFIGTTVEDANFSMNMSATGRRATNTLALDKKDVEISLGNQSLTYSYYCFKWRELSHLRFKISANILYSPKTFNSCKINGAG